MAAGRKPGPQCSHSNQIEIGYQTICRGECVTPGPVGIDENLPSKNRYPEFESAVFGRAIILAPAAVHRATGHLVGQALFSSIPVLLETLRVAKASLTSNAGSSLILQAAPVSGATGILGSLGLEFLPESADRVLNESICALQIGNSRGLNANDHKGHTDIEAEIEQAAEKMAHAAGFLVRAILQSIVAHLVSNSSTVIPRRVPPAWAVSPDSRPVIADQVVGQLVTKLRSSKLGDSFASWVEQNYKDLVANPQLRLKPRLGGGSVSPSYSRASSERRSRPAIVSTGPSVNDPSTFSSDHNLAAQAASLVAAAATGVPFCLECGRREIRS